MPKCDYGCGGEGKFFFEIPEKWCCSKFPRQCISYRKERFNQLQQIAKNKRGKILSKLEDFKKSNSKLEFECEEKHRWFANAQNVFRCGSWCKICAGFSNYTIEDLHKKVMILEVNV